MSGYHKYGIAAKIREADHRAFTIMRFFASAQSFEVL